ncbi:ATP-dependent nuclease [Paradevosia shaoguanensis]|uniref:ATP-dependent nuclease n=1 Tax=Paradevosia shaoguanensis TaxID=1335043 RepID=UPI003C7429AC
MARIRHIKISNFRGIRELSWFPRPGLNCIVGPGDSGKSTVLDAIDLCLGARRTTTFSDADFHGMDVDNDIVIEVTVGDLADNLKSMETYGHYLRNFDADELTIDDEPESSGEVVLTLVLTISADLEPVWTLKSERAPSESQRYLTWADRNSIAPMRLGNNAGQHMGWRRGSVLNRLSDEKTDAAEALATAARAARQTFGDRVDTQLSKTLVKVAETARALGVPADEGLRALLDAHSVSFGSGVIALHDKNGVPLESLGTGSARLLSVGLQRAASEQASIVVVDELEYGLEPHRIMRLLGSLGAKEQSSPLQGFLTTHSPVAVRELSSTQLFVMQRQEGVHFLVALPPEAQGTVRRFPEALLAASIIVCEGASEVGFIRAIDRKTSESGRGLFASGLALVDAGGCSKIYGRALPLADLGYRTAVFRDDDRQPAASDEEAFIGKGGKVFKWRDGKAIEDELFEILSDGAVALLLERAVALHGEELIEDQLSSASGGKIKLAECRASQNKEVRSLLARCAKSKASWFKNVGDFEEMTVDIVLPDIKNWREDFTALVVEMVKWARVGKRD